MAPPEVVRIDGAWWRLVPQAEVKDEDGVDQAGLTDYEELRLIIKLGNEQVMRQTTLHEAMHAACPDVPEKYIRQLERGLFALFTMNKPLRDYVFGAEE